MKNTRILCLLGLSLFVVSAIQAQEVPFEDQLSLQAPTFTGATGLFEGQTGDTLEKGDWSFGTYFSEFEVLSAPAPELQPLSGRDKDMEYVEERFEASLGYGLSDRWELTMSFPYFTLDQNAGDLAGYINGYPYSGKFTENDIGNLRVGTKFGLLDPESTNKLALSGFWDINTGHEDSGIATGSPDYGAGLHWTRGVATIGATWVQRGERKSSNSPDGFEFDIPNETHLDFGLNIPLHLFPATNWISELNATVYSGGDRQPEDLVDFSTGLRHWFGDSGWGASALIRSNLSLAFEDNQGGTGFGYAFGVHYSASHTTEMNMPPPLPPVAPPPPPPPPAPVEAPPEPVAPPRGPQEIGSDEILFDAGSARLTNIAKAQLDDIALRMRNEPTATAVVMGYTDGSEKTGANNDLDRRRAEAVRDYLVSRHSIDPSRITLEAKGADASAMNPRRGVVKLIIP